MEKLTTSQIATLGALMEMGIWSNSVDIVSLGGHCASLPKLVELGLAEHRGGGFGPQNWRATACVDEIEVVAALHMTTGRLEAVCPISAVRYRRWSDEMLELGFGLCRMSLSHAREVAAKEDAEDAQQEPPDNGIKY